MSTWFIYQSQCKSPTISYIPPLFPKKSTYFPSLEDPSYHTWDHGHPNRESVGENRKPVEAGAQSAKQKQKDKSEFE